MNVVERQISATATQQDELRLRGRIEEDERLVDDADVLEDRVQVALFREYRRPGDAGRQVRDREREQEDVEEDPAASKLRVQQQRHAEREHELDRDDHDDQEERKAQRVVERRVVDHRVERRDRPVALLVAQREPEPLDHRPHEEQAEVGDGGKDQPVRQKPPTARSAREGVSLAIVVTRRGPYVESPHVSSTSPCRQPFRSAGPAAQQGAPSCRRFPGAVALVVEDVLDVLPVAHDPCERVAVDLLKFPPSAPMPIGSSA